MLRISTRSTYGIKALLYIYSQDIKKAFTVNEISKKNGIPNRYLEQIFRKLRIGGFVKSIRGPGGGYKVIKKPAEVKLGDLIKSLEGDVFPIFCLETEKGNHKCRNIRYCITNLVCRELDDAVGGVLDKYSIENLLNHS